MARLFLDTEFLELVDRPLQLISLALVTEDGRELYCVNSEFDRACATPWLAEHVLPYLDAPDSPTPISAAQIAERVRTFVADVTGDRKPQFYAWVGAYDWVLLNRLFGTMNDRPAGWPKHFVDLREWAQRLGNPRVPAQADNLHHALYDARHDVAAYAFLRDLEQQRKRKRDNRLREKIIAEMAAAARATTLA